MCEDSCFKEGSGSLFSVTSRLRAGEELPEPEENSGSEGSRCVEQTEQAGKC